MTLLAIAHNPKAEDPQKLITQFEGQLAGEETAYYAKEEMDAEAENKLSEVKKVMRENAEMKRKR